MENGREKGTETNPFYMLRFGFANNVYTIEPYLLVNKSFFGPRLLIEEAYPGINHGILNEIYFWYRERGSAMSVDFDGEELMRLAAQVDTEKLTDADILINAALVVGVSYDKRIAKKDSEGGWHIVTPVQFFHVEVKLPKQIKKEDIENLKRYNLL